MASRAHDLIVKMIEMKMKSMGFCIIASDQNYDAKEVTKLPPTILKHRPDVIGYRHEDDSVCIGEAKYYNDLETLRSKEQIEDFGNLCFSEKINAYAIFGVPSSEKNKLVQIMEDHLIDCEKIVVLEVPDRLLE
jgi:hypothetical protein